MTKRFLIFFAIVLFSNLSIAQEQEIDKDSLYKYFGKRAVIESTFAYMKDYAQLEKINDAEKKGIEKYKQKFILKNDTLTNIKFEDISTLLKNNSWSKTNSKIFSVLKKRYSSKEKLNSDFFKIEGLDSTYKNWNKITSKIVDDFEKRITKTNETNIISSSQSNQIDQERVVNNFQSYPNRESYYAWKDYLLYLAIFLLGLLIGIIFTRLKLKKKILKILNAEPKYKIKSPQRPYDSNSGIIETINIFKERKDFYKSKKEELEEKISELKDKYNSLKSKNTKLFEENVDLGEKIENKKNESYLKEQRPKENTYIEPTIKKNSPNETLSLFFSMPDSDGSFKSMHGVTSNDSKRYYKIEFQKESNKGTIKYIPSSKDQRAIKRIEAFLEPVCDIENPNDADTATEVNIIEPGKVNLVGDKWVIDENNKVKIRLC